MIAQAAGTVKMLESWGEKSVFGWFKKKEAVVAPAPALQIRMVQAELIDLLRTHGLDVATHEDWTLVDNKLPVLRGGYHVTRNEPASSMIQMDLELRLNAERSIYEHYAGTGETEEQAVAQALFKFCIGAFHVFLSAYWDHHEADQVDLTHWSLQGGQWDVFIGAMFNFASEGQAAGFPKDYISTVQEAISGLVLTPEDHWFSFYGANLKGELTMDAYLDNGAWPELNNRLKQLDWPPANGFYSIRNFILLRPAPLL